MGAAERGRLLPDQVQPGDVLLGLPSSGVHSNGFSLVRRVIDGAGMRLADPAPFAPQTASGPTLGEALLTPTALYVRPVLDLARAGLLRAAAHITGGGIPGNLPRILPEGTRAVLDATWPVPPIFRWLHMQGRIAPEEMLRVFNCGIGMVLVVRPTDVDAAIARLAETGTTPLVLGRLEAASGPSDVEIRGLATLFA